MNKPLRKDVEMTKLLHEATRSGQFQRFVNRPEFGKQWLQMVAAQRAAGAGPRLAGSFWPEATSRRAAAAVDDVPSAWGRARHLLPTRTEFKVLGGALGIGLAAAVAYSAFSGYDDSYNTIEGLNHGGLAELIDFGNQALFADPNRPAEFGTMLALPMLYPALAEELSVEGSRFARRNFGWTGIAKKIRQVFDRAIAAKYEQL